MKITEEVALEAMRIVCDEIYVPSCDSGYWDDGPKLSREEMATVIVDLIKRISPKTGKLLRP